MCEARVKLFKKLLAAQAALFFGVPVLADINLNEINSREISDKSNRNHLIADLSNENFKEEDEDNQKLKITVTGTRSPIPVDSYPGSITVIDREDIENKNINNLRDLMKEVPGVSTQQIFRHQYKGPTDGGNVNIRGLDGNRVLFLIDGIRLPERYEYTSYYNIGRGNYIDFNTLVAAEILKGPASALYGSDALGGLIAYRSLSPDDLLENGQDYSFEVPASYNSANDGFNGSIKIASKLTEKASAVFVYSKEDSEALKVKADDKYIDDEDHTGDNFFTNIVYDLNDYSKANIIYESVNRENKITSKQANLDVMGKYSSLESETDTNRDRISLGYEYDNPNNDGFIKFLKTQIYSQYAKVDDNFDRVYTFFGPQNKDHDYNLINDAYGGEIQLESEIKSNQILHKLTYGLDYSFNSSSRLRKTTNNNTSAVTEEKDTPDTDIKRTGFYIQDEFSSGKFDFIAGLRLDYYDLDAKTDSIYTNSSFAADLDANSLSPKLAATYNINPKLSTYGQYSRGFRAPTYMEINSSFSNPQRGYTTESNPDLKPETSDSFEVGLRGKYDNYDFKIAGFYSKYDDFIEQLKIVGKTNAGLDLYKSTNASEAEIWGTEISTEYFLNPQRYGTSLFGILSYYEGSNTTDNEPLTTIDPLEAKLGFKYKTKDNKFNIAFTSTIVGEPTVDGGTSTFIPDDYMIFDIVSSYSPSDRYSLNIGIYNITDERYYMYQDVQGKATDLDNLTKYSQPERNIQVGFKFRF